MIPWMLVSLALAQDGEPVPSMNVMTYRPSIDAERTLWTDDVGTSDDQGATARFMVGYQRDPLVHQRDDAFVSVLSDVAQLDLLGGYTWGRLRIGGYLPVYALTQGDTIGGGGGLGDAAVDLRGTLVRRGEGPVGLALAVRGLLPTATVDAPVSAGGFGYEVSAIVDRDVGPVRLAANLGTLGAPRADLPNTVVGPAFTYRAGAGWAVTEGAGLSADLGGRATYAAIGSGAGVPLEALVGGWGRIGHGWTLRGGVGRGLTRGIGAPTARAVLGIAWEPPRERDTDGDGIVDDLDACPREPEDFDGWQDDDGCPDPLTTLVLTVVDPDHQPITGAEVTLDGRTWTLEGEPLRIDLPPGQHGMEIAATGYLPDSGTVRVPEGRPIEETRVLTPEAKLGRFEVTVTDLGGRPLDARLRIGGQAAIEVTGGVHQGELAPGEYTVSVSATGYGPARLPLVVEADELASAEVQLRPIQVKVTRDKVEISDKVYFETAKATIRSVSFPLLDDVAAVLEDRVDIRKVRVEGHTDSRGGDDYNLNLSRERAAAVRTYLVEKGIAPERLVSEGFGESRPVDPRETAEAWEKNRRVEFVILTWEGDE